MTGRARSLWGWGWADRFPEADLRRALGKAAGALLGFEPGEPREPAPPRVPDPRIAPPASLAPCCLAGPEDRALRARGRSYLDQVLGFTGDFSTAPDLVARPRDEGEVAAVLDWAGASGFAVVPFGGGSSVVGGVTFAGREAWPGLVALDLGALGAVLEVDATSRVARIQAGALGPSLEAQLAPHGLTLRHFPQSFEFSTLGGWLATRAGGHFATLYTHIDDLTQAVRMVTPRGAWQTRAVPATGAGPDPKGLALGSEGILGVITEAWMRLQARPRFRARATVRFPDFAGAVGAARAVAQSGLHPANCRLLDPHEAALHRVVQDGSSVLLLAFESEDHPLEPWVLRALELCRDHGGIPPEGGPDLRPERGDATGAAAWRDAFLEMPYLQSTLISMTVLSDTFETCCTWRDFPALHAAVVESVGEALRRVCGGGRITCRFTHVYPDGPAPYYTFVGPSRPGSETSQWAEVKAAAAEALARHGGTITHHHAVGRLHRPWYDRERPEPFALALRAAKASLDPAGILNPGVLVDP
ncbi:FAD-binding oxidoreductase [Myxococcota bacterium]|nr:FAD-binding oxidoreductase [Myxococcota bacterium]